MRKCQVLTGFLVVALDRLRRTVVDHIADVGLVDAHAKSDRGADHLNLVDHPSFLDPAPLFVDYAGMVGHRAYAVLSQRLGHLLAFVSVDGGVRRREIRIEIRIE